SVAETLDGLRSGRISEVFACGTAAVITPIASLHNDEGDVVVGSGEAGEVTSALRTALMDIQYGRAEDRHNWLRQIA
ncbi:MAG: branched chain amino acid aminotransferase, partial [Microlunatus sp.]|nr:branched chain amino acid aminotransferase [Microlunatus sp.]